MHGRHDDEILSGKYRLIRLLGKGGMGSVWQAHHLHLNALVAVKVLDAEHLDAQALARFRGEARMAAALRSPHVVQILDYGIDDGVPHIAMELLDGTSLAQRLARVGRLSPVGTARVIQHVARALGRAHEAGIVHRDLKPENVFVVANDDEELIKVLDFGIAKGTPATLGSSAAETRTGALLGTPHYMSPEQLDGERSVDHRADLWSLGVLAYRCLLGELPFAGDSVARLVLAICSRPLPVPSTVGPVPAGFDAWFARACAREPSARFESARQAAGELLALCHAPGGGEAGFNASERGVAPGSPGTDPPGLLGAALPTAALPAVGDAGERKGPETLTAPAASADVLDEAGTRQRRVAARGGAAFALALVVLAAASWSARGSSPAKPLEAAPPATTRESPRVASAARAESKPEPGSAPHPLVTASPPPTLAPEAPSVLDPGPPPAPLAPSRAGAASERASLADHPRSVTPALGAVSSRSSQPKRVERGRAAGTAAARASVASRSAPVLERIPPQPSADVDLGI